MDYRHLKTMTDATGIIQFSSWEKPDLNSGYTVDDNARALLVALNMEGETGLAYARTYLRFLSRAQRPDGSWCNLLVHGRFSPRLDSEDCQGRAFMACCLAASSEKEEIRPQAREMAVKALPVVLGLNYPRAIAYTLIGLTLGISFLEEYHGQLRQEVVDYAAQLLSFYDYHRSPGWYWFEDQITYCNGILPHALFAYYLLSSSRRAYQTARDSLNFLCDHLFARGYLNIVGNRGWWLKGNYIPYFDQQPVDACSVALACLEAHRATGEKGYLSLAGLAAAWYLGKNINRLPLYNHWTGGCHDALIPSGLNPNQGAEAALSLLLTQQALHKTGLKPDTTGWDTWQGDDPPLKEVV